WDDGVEKINGPMLADTLLTKNSACFGCPVGCKRVVKVDDEKYKVPEGAGPEYETVAGYGTMMLIDNLGAICKINELCNQYGMDTITSGSTMAFLCECADNGLISKDDLDGVDLKWSSPDAVIELIGKIANREGCGDWIAEGSESAAGRIGKNSADFLTTVNRLESPMHDPRGFHGQGLAYATSSRGACHVNAMEMFVEQGYVFYPELGLSDAFTGQESAGKANMVAIAQNLGAILNAACICHFPAIVFTEQDYLNSINKATGFGYDLETLMKAGERMWVLKRAINNMFGLTRENDRLPKRITTPLEDGSAAGSAPDIGLMLKEYYEVRDIDEKGRPSKAKLESLGLGYMIEKIH
ncbi:MAG: aldehyde ferredoxin oxidoreductase C-terminal domain-containing protein, partial [bacterium]